MGLGSHAAVAPPSVSPPHSTTYLQTATSTNAVAIHDFGSQNLGAAASDRWIVVAMMCRASTTTAISATVTVGGIAATVVAETASLTLQATYTALAIVAVPTGTTGNVTVTYSRAVVRGACSLWRLTGYTSMTPTDTGIGTGNPVSTSLDVSALGTGFGCTYSELNATCTWAGLTEIADAFLGANAYSVASLTSASTQTLSASATWTSGSEVAGAFASWV